MSAVGQRTWAGFAKQPSYQTFVAPAIFQGISSFSPVDKIAYIARPESRGIAGRVVSAAGPFSFAGSFKAAPDPGAVEQLVAFALGNQTTPAFVPTQVSSATAAVMTTGSQTVGITPGSGSLFTVGQSVYFDYGGASQETIVITAKTANSITAVFANTHPTAAIVTGIATTATQSTYSIGTLNHPTYFSMQQNRDSDVLDRTGLAIDTMKIQVDSGGKLVDFDFSLVGCAALPNVDSSPATPAFATTLPYTSELALATYTGAAGAAQLGTFGVVPLQSLAITLNNQLDKNYRTAGNQFPFGFPKGTVMVSAVLKTGFENDQEFLDFLAQGTVALALKLTSQSIIETDGSIVIPYSMTFNMPKCRIMQDVVSQKTSGPLDQTVTLECYSSTIGANDDLSVYAVNTATAIY